MQKSAKQWKMAVVMISICVAGITGIWIPCASVRAADNTETKTDGDYQYEVIDDTIEITGYTGSGGNVVIPETINGKKVVSIGSKAFMKCEELTGITIPSGVTSIGSGAFFHCSGLTGSIEIPEGVTSIEDETFSGCSGLTEIKIPEGVTSIGKAAFQDCSSLTRIEIPSGVTSIEPYAFSGCSGLTGSITIPSGVTSIGSLAFDGCSGLTSIQIPDSVTSIGHSAFFGCSGLTEIEIPESVTSIMGSTFYGCSGLTEIEIPESVTSIGETAFILCSELTKIQVASDNEKYDSRNDCNAIIDTETNTLIAGCKNTSIPSGVTSIGNFAFDGCSGLTSITIPDSVTSIGGYTFAGCSSLTSITIPDSVTSIGDHAFYACPSDIVVYAEADSYADAWAKAEGYTVVNAPMPEKGTSEPLAEGTKITLSEFKCEIMVLPYDGETPKVTYVKSNDAESAGITVPDEVTVDEITYKVTGIEDGAFSDCTSVEEVVLPAPLENIGEDAFEQVVSAEEETEKKLNVKIPEGMENVETLGLENITNVINIIFYVPAGSNAQVYLEHCENVTISIYQPENKPDPGDNPEEKQDPPAEDPKQQNPGNNSGGKQDPPGKQPDTGDKEAETEQKPEVNKTYTVQGLTYKVTSSKNVSFAGAGKKTIKKLTVPGKVTILGQSFQVTAIEKKACKKYKKLETVVIGSNIKTIGDEAFGECKKLKKITIGKNVTTIGKKVFYKDKKLARIIFKGAKVKKIGKRALYNVPKKAKITAPKKAQKKYIRLLNAAK